MAVNLADYVSEAASMRGDHEALVFTARGGRATLTWTQLEAAIDACASGLRQLGLRPGERVAVVLGNVSEYVIGYFGLLRAGLVAVPLNPDYTAPELSTALADVGSRAVIVTADAADTVRAAVREIGADPSREPLDALMVVVGGPHEPGELSFADVVAAGRAAGPVPHETHESDLALIMYTSGTGGLPKGAMLTHGALVANAEQVAAASASGIQPADVVLMVLPLFHVYSLNGTLIALAKSAATGVLVDRLDTDDVIRVIQDERVTNVPAAPPIYAAWVERPDLRRELSSVRLLFSGAAPLAPDVQARVTERSGLVVHQGYGLTEAAPAVTTTLLSGVSGVSAGVSGAVQPGTVKPGSVGRPLPGVDVRLVDDDGDDAEEGDPGEIWIRGPNVFVGYWPDRSDGPDQDGWFATGDVAYADDEGELFLVDRRRELVIVNGFNVYPREVEDVVRQHPAVLEVAVVGIPDPVTGEAVTAYVVVAPPAAAITGDPGQDAEQLTRELRELCARSLARFKRPTRFEFVEQLPHSALGKVAKAQIGPGS